MIKTDGVKLICLLYAFGIYIESINTHMPRICIMEVRMAPGVSYYITKNRIKKQLKSNCFSYSHRPYYMAKLNLKRYIVLKCRSAHFREEVCCDRVKRSHSTIVGKVLRLPKDKSLKRCGRISSEI